MTAPGRTCARDPGLPELAAAEGSLVLTFDMTRPLRTEQDFVALPFADDLPETAPGLRRSVTLGA
jgi:hypothetical protein